MSLQIYHATVRMSSGEVRTVPLHARDLADAAAQAQAQTGAEEVLAIRRGPVPPPDAGNREPALHAQHRGFSVSMDRRTAIVMVALAVGMVLIAVAILFRSSGAGSLGAANAGSSSGGSRLSDSERAAQMLIEEQRRARKQAELDEFQDRLDRNADAFMRQQMYR
jgi:hypothetical protein